MPGRFRSLPPESRVPVSRRSHPRLGARVDDGGYSTWTADQRWHCRVGGVTVVRRSQRSSDLSVFKTYGPRCDKFFKAFPPLS